MKSQRSRTWLFVPADSPRKLVKGLDSRADVLILDLEDAVAPDCKVAAREAAAGFVRDHAAGCNSRLYVRVNPFVSGLTLADLAAVVQPGLDGIVLPKLYGGEDLVRAGHGLDTLEARAGMAPGSVRIVPVATETPQALLQAHGLLAHAGQAARVSAVTWGGEDLSAAVGATAKTDADGSLSPLYQQAESLCLLLAAAAQAVPLDTSYTDFRDLAGLRSAAARSRRRGFKGQIAIHPDQVAVINEAYAPSDAEVTHARRIVEAFARQPMAGTLAIDGVMVDRPHLVQAQAVLREVEPS